MVLLGLDPGQAVLLLVHEVAGQQKVSEVIHEKLELESFGSRPSLACHDSGIIYEDVEMVVSGIELFGKCSNRGGGGQICNQEIRRCSRMCRVNLVTSAVPALFGATYHHHVSAQRRQPRRGGFADPRRRAGDEYHFCPAAQTGHSGMIQ